MALLQEGGPLPGPETGLLSNTRKWIVRGDTCAGKARDFTGKGHPGREQEGQGAQEDSSVTWSQSYGFMVMALVSRLSLANHSDSESFLVVHALFSQDGCQREGFWEVVGQVVSPFDLSWTLPVGGGLLVPCSLPGPPVIKQLVQMVVWCLARVSGFSQCASPNSMSLFLENSWLRNIEDNSSNIHQRASFAISPRNLDLWVELYPQGSQKLIPQSGERLSLDWLAVARSVVFQGLKQSHGALNLDLISSVICFPRSSE